MRTVLHGPAYIAVGLGWLVVIMNVIVSRVIIRETSGGAFLIKQIDHLPSSIATFTRTILWFSFLLGWIIPVFFGIRKIFRKEADLPANTE